MCSLALDLLLHFFITIIITIIIIIITILLSLLLSMLFLLFLLLLGFSNKKSLLRLWGKLNVYLCFLKFLHVP